MDGLDHEDCHVDLPGDLIAPLDNLLDYCKEIYQYYRDRGKNHEEAVDIVCSIEPFDFHPAYRACLDSMLEGG